MARTHSSDLFHCNNCGAEVKINAKICPNCGSDDETAWKDGVNSYLVEEQEDFDYEEFVRSHHGGSTIKPKGVEWWVWMIAVVLLGIFLLRWLG
jgi:zinc-ribbon domain